MANRDWVGFASIALHRCGLTEEGIRAVLPGDDSEVVQRNWRCIGSGWVEHADSDGNRWTARQNSARN